MPHRDWEIHLHPRDPRGKIHSLRLSPRRVRRILALILLLVAWIAAGIAAAPRALRTRRSQSDYRAGVALRQELGDRTQALVARLGQLAERGHELRDRLERVERLYGTLPSPPAPEVAEKAAALPEATIFARRIAEGRRSAGALARDLERVEGSLARISAHERAAPGVATILPVRSPLPGDDVVLASGFGPRRSPYTRELEFHGGIDFAAPRGTPVVAPADGVVAWTGVMTANPRSDWWRLGRTIVVRHGDRIRTLYGHLEAIEVRPGQKVRAGARLGRVGETGWTTAPHLHYEIRRLDGSEWLPVDPRQFLLALPAPDARGLPESWEGGAPLPSPLPRAFQR